MISNKGFKRKKSGFTLIELMVVMAIIGIVINLASSNSSRVLRKSRDSALLMELDSIRTAIYQFSLQHNGEFPEKLEELSPDFVRKVPVSWTGSNAKGRYGYKPETGQVFLMAQEGDEPSEKTDEKGVVYGTY